MSVLERVNRAAGAAHPERVGVVSAVVGVGVQVRGLPTVVGDLVTIGDGAAAEVVASSRDYAHVMPLTGTTGLGAGAPVRKLHTAATAPTGNGLLGRVIDGLGRPLDGLGPIESGPGRPLRAESPNAMTRTRIDRPLQTGVRAVDTTITLGRGQRIGLFAGSGVGKSSLLSMVARGTDAEVSVIALIGERGREVREFLEDDLGPEGLARSIVVVATSDEPALMRLRAAMLATAIAEGFRADGADVVLMMDSLTRVAMAQREIGLSAGEVPATRGYPPSMVPVLASLLERAGTDATGSITGIYTVLVDGDDHNEPVADTARSILDGHVVLDRSLATRGHFPSIRVTGSVSRVASKVLDPGEIATAATLRRVLAAHEQAQDLIDVGAYRPGQNKWVDAAVAFEDDIDAFLRQGMGEQVTAEQSWAGLRALVAQIDAHVNKEAEDG